MPALEVETSPGAAEPAATLPERTGAPAMREVRHGYPRTFPLLLSRLGVSLLVPTHHAGKVVAGGVARGELTLSYHNFERAMGLDVKPDCLAVGSRAQVWSLKSTPSWPPGRAGRPPRACFLTRFAHFIGEVQTHEVAWGCDRLWLVNPAFGCLLTLAGRHSFLPRWRPPFLTALAPTALPARGQRVPPRSVRKPGPGSMSGSTHGLAGCFDSSPASNPGKFETTMTYIRSRGSPLPRLE
jgi:hypothetical protein